MGSVDKQNKKVKVPILNLHASDDTVFQTSRTPSNIIKTYGSKATTQPIIQSTVNYIFYCCHLFFVFHQVLQEGSR